MRSYHLHVDVADAIASSDDIEHEYGFPLIEKLETDYDVVIIAVPHQAYKNLDETYFTSITKPHALIADLKGIYRNKIHSRKYWSL